MSRIAALLSLLLLTWSAPVVDLPRAELLQERASAQGRENGDRASARARSRRRAAAARARRARLARQRRAEAARRARARRHAARARAEVASTEPATSPDPDTSPRPSVLPSPEGPIADPAALSAEACLALLDEHSVRYRRVDSSPLLDLISVEGPIGGIDIAFVGRNRVHTYLDCRVAAAVLAWAPELRAASVKRIRHLSIYRPGATVETTGRPSGHSAGLAMDVRFLDLEDGRSLDVLADWGDRTRRTSPCPASVFEADPSALIRTLVCAAVDRDLFETVITPHHDESHQNHVHVEVVPDVTWRFVR